MDKWKKIIQDSTLIYDIVNTLLGFILVILLILALRNPQNSKAVMAAFFLGGFMNILNGIKNMRTSKKNSMGMSFIILGIIIIFIGYFITSLYRVI